MGTVVQHPAVIDAQQRDAASRLHDLTNTIEDIVVTLVEARCDAHSPEARDGITAMVCTSIAARASGRASTALVSDPLEDWRSAATLGDAIISDALERAAAKRP